MPSVVVIGSSNVDLVMKVGALPAVGETVLGGEYSQAFGGKGANQAVAAARAGAQTLFVTCIGNDPYAAHMKQAFVRDGMDTRHVFEEADLPSGYALIMVDRTGRNYITVASGANLRLTPERVQSVWSDIERAGLIVLQNELSEECCSYVLERAHAASIPVLWNVAPAGSFPKQLFADLFLLVVNENEAEALTGIVVSDSESAGRAASELLTWGCKAVLVTLGPRGCVFHTAEGKRTFDAFRVDAVDTTAAGDTFCGALAAAHAEGLDLPSAIQFAQAAAALSVSRLGAQPSVPHRNEIEAFLTRQRRTHTGD